MLLELLVVASWVTSNGDGSRKEEAGIVHSSSRTVGACVWIPVCLVSKGKTRCVCVCVKRNAHNINWLPCKKDYNFCLTLIEMYMATCKPFYIVRLLVV